jgi:hypothetical protein
MLRSRCKAWAVEGSSYCRQHGKGTGPRTPEGCERSYAARRAGYARMVAEQRAAGLPLPGGRPAGSWNKTPEQREREAAEKEDRRIARELRLRNNADRRARREARRRERDEQAVLDRRRERFHAGDPDWYDTGLLDLALDAIREGGGATKRELAPLRQVEKQFLARLSDVRDPPAPEAVQRAYAKLVRVETALGDDGKDGRLAKLRGAYNDWWKRRSTDAVVEHVARVRAANGGELPPADCPPDDDRKARELQRAIEICHVGPGGRPDPWRGNAGRADRTRVSSSPGRASPAAAVRRAFRGCQACRPAHRAIQRGRTLRVSWATPSAPGLAVGGQAVPPSCQW